MRKTILSLLLALMAFTVPTAFADPINPFNTRPTFVNLSSPDGPTTDMQDILNSWAGVGVVNALTAQQSTGMWAATTGLPFASTPLLRFEYAGNAALNTLGIWSGTDTASVTEHLIFTGSASGSTVATILWTTPTSGSIIGGAGVNTGTFTGIAFNAFGFYLDRVGGIEGSVHFSTVDQLNGGAAQAVSYRKGDSWLVGFEDLKLGGSDRDYNDFVFSMESVTSVPSVTAVPEPEVYAMLAAGLGLMGFVARRRKAQVAV